VFTDQILLDESTLSAALCAASRDEDLEKSSLEGNRKY